ncbi:serine hydrolase domain-containing protein [Urechidicola sp. KH5]
MRKLLLLFVFVSFSLNGQTLKFEKIDSIIDAAIKENHPGLAVGIVKNGEVVYERYRGLSNLQHQISFDQHTRSNIASTAKQFTALMVLDLSLKQKLNLEDDVRKHVPSLYPNVPDEIKIRHLINHTSGVQEYVDLLSEEGPVWWKRVGLDNNDVIELLEKQKSLAFKPGSKYAYSNSNYNILATIVERVTGISFVDYSSDFFENLGMKETSFVKRYMGVIPNRANPYSDWGRGEWWETPTVTKTSGEGFLFTTLKDQLIFEQMIQASIDTNNLLKISQDPIPNSEIKTYGFGLKLNDRLNRKAVHHDGVTYGFHSQIIRFPEEKLAIFIMSNNGNIRSDLMADEIASFLLSKK